MVLSALVFKAMLFATAAEAKVFECVLSGQYVCHSGRGCGQVHNDSVVRLNWPGKLEMRLQRIGYDAFDVIRGVLLLS